MKRAQASVPVKKVKAAAPADISEGFRRARSSISDITAEFQQLQQRARSTVKRARRPAKSK